MSYFPLHSIVRSRIGVVYCCPVLSLLSSQPCVICSDIRVIPEITSLVTSRLANPAVSCGSPFFPTSLSTHCPFFRCFSPPVALMTTGRIRVLINSPALRTPWQSLHLLYFLASPPVRCSVRSAGHLSPLPRPPISLHSPPLPHGWHSPRWPACLWLLGSPHLRPHHRRLLPSSAQAEVASQLKPDPPPLP